MSKTIRRKNFEKTQNTSWDKQGSKIAGYYTEADYVAYGLSCYREPTEQEYFDKYYWAHGESKHANQRSPGKSYRKPRTREWRQKARQELHRFMTREDYEVVLDANPINCWWDWS